MAFVTVYFYDEEEMKKGRFIAVIPIHKWYYYIFAEIKLLK